MRRQSSLVANPVLIGAVTILITSVAVFLSYNANNGLPFVPTIQLEFDTPDGTNLLPGNEVRLGGARAGKVVAMRPVALADGTTGARVTMKLDRGARIPRDSRLAIRPRSPLGLKYVEVLPGGARQTYRDGDVIAPEQTRAAVELEDMFRMYDARTRQGIRDGLRGFGDGLTARGRSLNETFGELPRTLRHLEPVMRSLAAPSTDLDGFWENTGRAARIVEPVSEEFAGQSTSGADTFEAWGRHERELAQTIERTPASLDAGIETFPRQRVFLDRLRDFSGALERAAQAVPRSLPRVNPALTAGTRALGRSPQLNRPLTGTMRALDRLMRDPATGSALRGLGATTGTLNPLVRYLGPFFTVCNYWNYGWTFGSDVGTERDPTGTSARVMAFLPPRTRDPRHSQLGSLGAARPVNGDPVLTGSIPHLHLNLGSAAVDDQGRADCESGQRGYVERNARNAPPELKIAIDPRIPGNQGPTYKGRTRVPDGQTFTRNPELGPGIPKELDP